MDLPASSIGTVERLLNALVEESTAARELLGALQDKRLGLSLTGPELELVLEARGESLRLRPAPAGAATVTLRGTPLALLMLVLTRERSALQLEGSGVSFAGDAQTLEQFAQVLDLLRPDLEEEVARLTGDVIAHQTFRVARSAGAWTRRVVDALALNTAEFLQEETRDLPARPEAERFFREVERLRDDVERALARARRLEPADRQDASCADSA